MGCNCGGTRPTGAGVHLEQYVLTKLNGTEVVFSDKLAAMAAKARDGGTIRVRR